MNILTIPAVPPSPNELRRKYRSPYAYRKLRKAWEHDLAYSVAGSWRRKSIIEAAKTGKMSVQMTIHHVGTYDADNLQACQKPVLDAMVNIGYLAGDDGAHLQLLPAEQVKCARKDSKTVIKLNVWGII